MVNETTDKGNEVDENTQLNKNLKKIKNKFAVMSGKGGVGKSTIATNLAVGLATQGSRVGLLDVDIHGPNIAKMLKLEGQQITTENGVILPIQAMPNLKVMSMAFLLENPDTPVIWRGPVKMGAIRQFLSEVKWGDLDYLIIDLPPGTGDEPLSIAQLIPNMSGALIVTTPQEVALLDSRKSVTFARTLGIPIVGIIENMSGLVCPHCTKGIDLFKHGGGERAARDMSVPFLGSIPIDPAIVSSGDDGKPFVNEEKESPSIRAMESIIGLTIEFVGRAKDKKK